MLNNPRNLQVSLFPPQPSQLSNSKQDPKSLGAMIADAYYDNLKQEVKEKFLRLSHIARFTTPNIVELYRKIPKEHLQEAKEAYVEQVVSRGYVQDTESPTNLMLQFMSGWQIAVAKT